MKQNLRYLILGLTLILAFGNLKAETKGGTPATVVDIVVNSEDHTTLEAAVVAAGLVETLQGDGPFTVFAPTDAAFAALPEETVAALLADIPALTDILTYHVAAGKAMSTGLSDMQKIVTVQGRKITVTINDDGVFIDNSKVTVADIEADNGVVHVIDAVLMPSTLPETVVDIVVNSEAHTTLEAAVVAAGLVETLQGDGPFTVFAPTDAAFAALPEGTVAALLADIPALTDILTYHVAAGKAMSTGLSDMQKIVTVQGRKITVTINDDGVFIDNSKVTVADIEADNGVVHVIDAVLMPSTLPETVVDIVVNSEAHTTLEAAVVAAGLVETLQGDGPFTVFAPTDAAFAALPEGTVAALLADIPALTDILTYHVVGAKAMSSDLSDGQMIVTVNGKEIEVTINEDGVFIDSAKVTVADIEADNGVVHVIDVVLIPPVITVVDIIVDSEDHTTLEAAVVAAGLVETLQGDGPFTVFAPTDAAFAALPEGTVAALLADIPALTDILTYHVAAGKTMSTDLSDMQKIVTVQGRKITVTINDDGVFIDSAKVTVADIEADNGVVHVIDAVLMPSTLPETVVDIVVNSEDHTTLEAAVVAAGLVETLQGDGPFTVFAPTDAAFAALPEGTVAALLADIPALTDILTYHVVAGKAMSTGLSDMQKIVTVQGRKVTVTINEDGVFIDSAKVTVADIEADNGVVHVIDAVLMPSTLPETVVDIVVNSEAHTTLEAAVVAAGLVETLQGDGPFTVFAPTDAAFAALPEGTVAALLADIPALTDILTYHVVAGKAMSTGLSDMQKIVTVQGRKITVTINDDGVFIDNAKVTVADIEADNGVVHVIDAVLMPSTLPETVVDIVVNSEAHTTLEAAVVAAGLVETLQGDGPFTVFAPTDAAFAALPEGTVAALLADIPALTDILTYHVVGAKAMSTDLSDMQKIVTVQGRKITVTINDDGVFIDNAKVTVADIEADNGVVHVIDAVLMPSALPETVVDIVVNSEAHTTLEAAVVAAGLVETLQGDGPFTVFAPTDAAFAALPEGTVAALLADIPALTDILTYHVAAGKTMSTDLSNMQKIVTVQGRKITVTINEDGVFIDSAKVTVADIEADNGVVHVIDAVLIPPVITVVDIIVDSEDHTTLEAAVVAAGLVETLQGDGPFTVFAPTDAAFAALPEGTVAALLADIPALTDILTYHVAAGKTMSTDLSDMQKIVTVQGRKITVTINDDGVFIDSAKVTVADIEADNGVVHVIDAVLMPSTLPETVVDIVVNSEAHTTLEAAVVAAGLVETLQGDGPFTVFAPTDAAFAALPEGTVAALLADIPALTDILTYHVAAGKTMSTGLSDMQKIVTVQGRKVTVTINEDGVFIDSAKVTVADIEADNGVVHVIDAVLMPSTLPETVVDIVVNSEAHTTLEAAVVAAGLVETLQGDGPFTVFAPTDAAFAALPEGTVAALLADIPALTDILTYHVAAGKTMSTGLSNMQKIVTVQGRKITVTINDDGVFIDNAKVTVADIEADNGVVHVIDAVLMPSTLPETVVDIVVNSEAHTTLEAAVVAAGLVETLQGDGPFTVFAPTDAAFAALPEGTVAALLADIPALTDILTYHVVGAKAMSTDLSDMQKIVTVQGRKITVTINDDGVFIDNAKVTVADIEADNGVVHVIDAVLMPSALPETVVDIVVNSEAHTTLEAAVVAAGLVETLQGDGPFTVFAPTDAAFAALPEGTVAALLADIPALTDILTYHVAAGKTMSTDLSNMQKIVTVQGRKITVTINEDGVFIDSAKVTVADIEADNGVVHVIDAVLLPNQTPTSVNDFNELDVKIYPNPASDILNIQTTEPLSEIRIVNLAGVTVLNRNSNSTYERIDISSYVQGIYFVIVGSGNDSTTRKIIVR